MSISRHFESRLAKGIGWLTGAELISRIGRLVAAIVLARQLDAVAFGTAALALTIFECVRVFAENGVGASVIRASADDFHKTANTAHRIMWWVCGALAALQSAIGLVLIFAFSSMTVGWMVISLAGVYLLMPLGLVHAYTLQRQQNMKRLAIVSSSQTVLDHLLTAALALTGFGAWAIVAPKLLTAPVWVVGVRYGQPWKPRPDAGTIPLKQVVEFSGPVLASELTIIARDQFDKFVVGLFLGIEALGLYYFAFNAGLGLSSALNRAFNQAFYPHLCRVGDAAQKALFLDSFIKVGLPLCAVYLFQAVGAFFYVPLIFGTSWADAAPLVALICLMGPSRLLFDATRLFHRAEGRVRAELETSVLFTAGTLAPLAVCAPFGLGFAVIASVSGASVIAMLLLLRVVDVTPQNVSALKGDT